MVWLWISLVPVAAVGGFFLVRGFMKVHRSVKELQAGIATLGSAGTSLRKVQSDLDEWREALDKTRRQ